jgi:hypothetical protein
MAPPAAIAAPHGMALLLLLRRNGAFGMMDAAQTGHRFEGAKDMLLMRLNRNGRPGMKITARDTINKESDRSRPDKGGMIVGMDMLRDENIAIFEKDGAEVEPCHIGLNGFYNGLVQHV